MIRAIGIFNSNLIINVWIQREISLTWFAALSAPQYVSYSAFFFLAKMNDVFCHHILLHLIEEATYNYSKSY